MQVRGQPGDRAWTGQQADRQCARGLLIIEIVTQWGYHEMEQARET